MSIAKLIEFIPKCEKTNKTLTSIRVSISTNDKKTFYAPFHHCPDCNTYKRIFEKTNKTFNDLKSISLNYINSINIENKKYQKQDIKEIKEI